MPQIGLAKRQPATYPVCMVCSKNLGRACTIALEGGMEIGDGKVFIVCGACYTLFKRLEEMQRLGLLDARPADASSETSTP